MEPFITFTPSAIQHIKNMLTKQPNAIGFRLSLKKTGCSGYAYVPKLIEAISPGDLHFMAAPDLPVYVAPDCESFIKNMVIDYVADELGTGMRQKRLVFINPNEKNRCGCGESFTLK